MTGVPAVRPKPTPDEDGRVALPDARRDHDHAARAPRHAHGYEPPAPPGGRVDAYAGADARDRDRADARECASRLHGRAHECAHVHGMGM